MSLEPKRPVTIEDLLQLKRTERPPAEFWDQFDRSLRAKQLAALVEKRPWWRTLPETFGSWRRYARYTLPLGATAILAVTFLAFRDRSPAPTLENSSAPQTIAAAQPIAREGRNAASESFAPREASTAQFAALSKPAVAAPAHYASVVTPSEAAVELAPGPSALEGASAVVMTGANDLPPSARHIATNLMVAQITDPTLARGFLATPAALEVNPVSTRTSEPLAQIASATSTRYARIRSAMASPVVNTVARESDRVAHGLSDDRLSEDAIRRFAARGDRLSVKF